MVRAVRVFAVVLFAAALAALLAPSPVPAQGFKGAAKAGPKAEAPKGGAKEGGAGGAPVDPTAGPAIVDTHAHLDTAGRRMNFAGDAEDAVAMMDRFGVKTTLIMPPPEGGQRAQAGNAYDFESLLFLKPKYPGRFAVMGGPGTLLQQIFQTPADQVSAAQRDSFMAAARDMAGKGIAGFGEFGIHHLSLPQMGPNHAYISVPADHPFLLALADVAAETDLPIDVHFDMVPADMPILENLASHAQNPRVLTANLAAFERLVAHNEKARIVWAHVGGEPISTRTPDVVRDLLTRHPNLYMSIRVARGNPNPAWALTPDGKLKPTWRELIVAFQDRFVLGSDAFYTDNPMTRRGGSAEGFENFRRLLEQLPPPVAEKIAAANARRIYPKAGL